MRNDQNQHRAFGHFRLIRHSFFGFCHSVACLTLTTAVLLAVGEAHGVLHLRQGMEAPAIVLKDLEGIGVSLADFRDRPVVVVFGEVYHEKSRQACGLVHQVIQDKRLAGQEVVTLLVVTQAPRPQQLQAHVEDNLPPRILHDPDRRAFGAYQVAVMPSIVVIDARGRIVHAVAGLTARLGDLVTDSLLLAGGRLSAEQFEQALNPQPAAEREDELRVERTTLLARQLARRGLDEMAAEKYREVLEMQPRHVPARLGLGMLLLKHRRLPDAENQFRAVLEEQPQSVQASLGLAFVKTLRGGPELDEAQKMLDEVMGHSPLEARAHYLQGLIHEQRGRTEAAAGSFKRSAQLLLERGEQEQEP